MSQDISSQVTEGILKAFTIIIWGSLAVYLSLKFWWVLILLTIVGLVLWGFWRLIRNVRDLRQARQLNLAKRKRGELLKALQNSDDKVFQTGMMSPQERSHRQWLKTQLGVPTL